ncbi:MAG TPA: glycosyl hydrolase family 65 protein [Thermoleophilia bacterium]|nr:glycosyl hydrolase family 65 protein [Thermoleophilia bacterium]
MSATGAFEVDPWAIRETSLDLDRLAQSESIFALSNGHLGIRGTLDEGEPCALVGTYLNGFHESYPILYPERAFGFPEDGQTIVNVSDGTIIRLLIEDEPLDVHRGSVRSHERVLDLRTGVLERRLTWRSIGRRRVRVRSRRLVSFRYRSVAAISYEVEALDAPLRVALQSNLVAGKGEVTGTADPRGATVLGDVLESRLHVRNGRRVVLVHRTRASGLTVAAGMDHLVVGEDGIEALVESEPDLGRLTLSATLTPGRPLQFVKFLAYHWSGRQSAEWLRDQVDGSLQSALAEGFEGLERAQREYLDGFWGRADIQVDGSVELQQALRYGLFQTLQASARAEQRAIAAKGLTGTGYDGHAFWDTEALVLPVLTYIQPGCARAALAWRHSTLDLARERARQLGLRGAAFPWRTIRGEECSAYWPAGTAAFHVNASIADAVRRYVQATADEEFERDVGVELLVETARLWRSLGHWRDGATFCIDGVTGPDEYSAVVDNNVYTNLMAAMNLRAAADSAGRQPGAAAALGVTQDEIESWRAAADAMYVPYDEHLGIHPQDQDFLTHERWDFAATSAEDYPLLLNYTYFDLYRKQVVKQADLVYALYLRSSSFSAEEKRRDFDYYEGVTVRDSSLSAAVQSIVAAEVGHLDLALRYLAAAAFTDLWDLEHNIRDGLHIASLSGAVLAVIAGLGGLRDDRETLSFSPRLPSPLTRVAFCVRFGGATLRVEITPGGVTYSSQPGGADVRFLHDGEPVDLPAGGSVERPLPSVEASPTPEQPLHRAPPRWPVLGET